MKLEKYLSVNEESVNSLLIKENRVPLIVITDQLTEDIQDTKDGYLIKTNGNSRALFHPMLSIQQRINILKDCILIEQEHLKNLN